MYAFFLLPKLEISQIAAFRCEIGRLSAPDSDHRSRLNGSSLSNVTVNHSVVAKRRKVAAIMARRPNSTLTQPDRSESRRTLFSPPLDSPAIDELRAACLESRDHLSAGRARASVALCESAFPDSLRRLASGGVACRLP